MVRNLLLLAMLCLVSTVMVAQTSLTGKVTDEETGEPILYGTVSLYKDGSLVTGTDTDLDGFYNFPNIDPGTYDVEVSYVGYATARQTGITVYGGQANKADVKLGTGGGVDLETVVVTEYKVPLVEQDKTTSGGTLTSEQLKKLPTRNIGAIAANVAGVSSGDEGDDLYMKGSRSASTFYMVDGIRVQGGLIAESEIEQIQIVTGGIEAQYGDVTGGLINITTKGPSKKFSGSVEAETSEFLDPYRNSLIGGSLSGPILTKKDEDGNVERSILGFRLSGRYTYRYDDDPPGIPVYRVTDEKLAELEANPVVSLGESGRVVSAEELVGPGDVQELDAKPFENRNILNLTAKLDARLSDAIDVTLTGSYVENKDRFTPGSRDDWRVFNSHNNPYRTDTDYRGNFRFRHRLGKQTSGATDEERASSSPIQNFSYIVQLGFERNYENREDVRHEDRLFDYGYIGRWDYEWRPSFDFENTVNGLVATQSDYTPTFLGYTPGSVNPILAAYNNNSDLTDDIDIIARNGQVSNQFDRSYEYHRNVGWVYDLFRKQEADTRTLNLTGNFDFKPGGSSKSGLHNVQFGLMYEERIERQFDVDPFELWQVADQQVNRHILGVDTSNVIGQTRLAVGLNDSLDVDLYGTLLDTEAFSGNRFYRKVRELTGQGIGEYVNVHELTPEQMSLGLFSAQELTDRDYLNYYGYDYTGNKFDGTFEDFFTARDEDGIRTFPNAPNRPIYTSAYIQDKFTFKDIIFRLGLRVDRFDANTKVLKDPYSLYEIIGAADFHNNPEFGADDRPGNIGDDFKVYVSSDDGTEIKAYRDGDQWYRANGTPVNSGSLIFDSGSLVFPKLKNVNARTNTSYIKTEEFDLDASFKDYEVQVNFMPRLAFSFPISDDANFFAHYDILVQRPASNNIVTAKDYFYFAENFENGRRNVPKNNANLLPEKTIDYEVGFQQKLTNSSALKVAAYYKEMRNLIQRRTFQFVNILNSYETYDNQDFGTVKGFTFQYDLRRTGNVSGLIGYTLQFADGTGSDPNSSSGLSSRENLRTLFPLSFDERHRLNASLDYRYRSGKKYNGPSISGVDIFANTGVNLQAVMVSGRPFTAKSVPAEFDGDGTIGAINGARLPWNTTLNLRVDKDFKVGGPKGVNVNAYLRVSNLLNKLNWRNLYRATASPENDGFLQSSRGASVINSLNASNRNLDNFFASYQWRLLNPDFYSQPRRIFVGLSFGF